MVTRKKTDVEPGGTISHAEIMLQVRPGDWRRWSIGKQRRALNESGDSVWKPGEVHCKDVDVLNDDYIFLTVYASRQQQEYMYKFLQSQVGAKFNNLGYFYNFWTYGFAFGTRRYKSSLLKRHRRWFCTELIVTALQSGKIKFALGVSACRVSPNALYRLCAKTSLPTTNPSRRVTIDL